ncbi:hypothetical protein MPL3356_400064 [Mesorhizobium plurifarium]|uniref:Uncharacterized protein n=1 Tax=Mesorhizobium plurifarium TaxID=69974 RepID=A0A090EAE6_MESPL|nr:hypothetical protein MPL3356_400064 [Mesorhizobium plurifarium]
MPKCSHSSVSGRGVGSADTSVVSMASTTHVEAWSTVERVEKPDRHDFYRVSLVMVLD